VGSNPTPPDFAEITVVVERTGFVIQQRKLIVGSTPTLGHFLKEENMNANKMRKYSEKMAIRRDKINYRNVKRVIKHEAKRGETKTVLPELFSVFTSYGGDTCCVSPRIISLLESEGYKVKKRKSKSTDKYAGRIEYIIEW
jgi:hypothetical protein